MLGFDHYLSKVQTAIERGLLMKKSRRREAMLLAVIIFHFFLAGLNSRLTIRRQGESIVVLFFAPSGSIATAVRPGTRKLLSVHWKSLR